MDEAEDAEAEFLVQSKSQHGKNPKMHPKPHTAEGKKVVKA